VVIKEVEKPVEVPAGATLGRIRGSVLEQGESVAVADARISFPGREATRLLSAADGTFLSYGFAPGPVQLEIEADGYEAGNCSTTIPPAGGDVSLACMIVPLPRIGTANLTVLDDKGAPLVGVPVAITGPDSKSANTDVEGKLRLTELKPGEYRARVEHPGYLISVSTFVVKVREETSLNIQLFPTPKSAAVKVQGDKLQVRGTIFFAPNTAQIEARSTPLLAEIANVLLQHPELLQLEVQGHTDDSGSPARNQKLAQERAQAVASWLVSSGVERDRLVAKGYGSEKPLAPNLTEQNRARNRRVEFVILQRAGQ
jgi:outer membrane protein OmpA-like peptidoglycan-associated protein